MDKKGLAWATLIVIIVIIISFIIIFGWQIYFGKEFKPEAEATTCKLSVIRASSEIGFLEPQDLPKLACPKIPVEIKSKNVDEIKRELFDLIIKTSNDFGVSRKTYSKITGTYCRRRYHPITFIKKGLKIKGFSEYLKGNLPKGFVGDFNYVTEEIDTAGEYSILFVTIYKRDWTKWLTNPLVNLALGISFKYESQYLGYALVRSDEILESLECDHLV